MDEEPNSSKRKRSDSEERKTKQESSEKRKKTTDVWQQLDLSEGTVHLGSELLSLIKQKKAH